MKFETLMLQIVFSAGLLLCVLTLGAMITVHAHVSTASTTTGDHAPAVAMTH